MANEERTILDPFHNKVYLTDGICFNISRNATEIYDDASMVIRKPAMMIEVHENDDRYLYYFRSVGWHSTMLITVHFNNERWETFECKKNPTNETLSALLKKGRQLV